MVSNVILYFLSLILIGSGIGVLMYSYFKEHDCQFRFKNTFPYELNRCKTNTFNVVGKILISISLVSLGAFFFVYPINRDLLGPNKAIASLITVFGVLGLLSFLYISMIDMSNVKLHLLGDTFLFVFSFILTVSISVMGFWTLRAFHDPNNIDIKKIVCGAIAAVVALLELGLLVNPKLRNWAKLEEKSQEDGSKIYLRPKWFALAYSEWAFFFSFYLNALLLFIMFI